MIRSIIKINEEICNGCGKCAEACPEGAIKMINGKAKLVSENYCDGLGACIGDCPVDAITIERRQAKEYDQESVIENIIKGGPETIIAHLNHLKKHGENRYLNLALKYLSGNGYEELVEKFANGQAQEIKFSRCPGSKIMDFSDEKQNETNSEQVYAQPSELSQWPVQMHLISPDAGYFKNEDVLIAADCTAYALGNFHSKYLKGKKLVICCPKLDSGLEQYKEKITALVDRAEINSLTVMIMQVPCCSGLLHIAKQAIENAKRHVTLKYVVVGIKGQVLKQDWLDFSKKQPLIK